MKCPKCGHEWINATRSTQQNKYYWSILDVVSNETGDTREALHEYFKERFNSTTIHVLGDEVKVIKSTASLTTIGFKTYISKIVMFSSAELGIIITEPRSEDAKLQA